MKGITIKKIGRILIYFAFVVLLTGCGKKIEDRTLTVLFTSDIHCGIDQGFGFVGLASLEEQIEGSGNYTILVDNGDAIQGEPIGTLSKGNAIVNLMNKAGYDVAIPGNHEFDYGVDTFLELTKKAEFPYISCNFVYNGETVFEPYVIKEVGGRKIAFVGISTPKTLTSSTPRYFQNEQGEFVYGFLQDSDGSKLYEAVQSAVDKAKAAGADFVIAMGHLGNEAECEPWTYADVIANTTGIDAFLDGHSHDTEKVTMKNKDGKAVTRTACGTKMSCVGYLNIALKDGTMGSGVYTWNDDGSSAALYGNHENMAAAVEEEKRGAEENLKKVVAKSSVELTINDPVVKDENGNPVRMIRSAETNLGDFCADAYRAQAGSQIAFVNGGGIRVSINQGDVTLGDILGVHPFGNTLCVVEATGKQILDALEWGARVAPGESGSFQQVSGISFEIHTEIESSCVADENGMFVKVLGEYRVKNVKVGDEPLDLNKTYTLASHNYMLKNGGDGFTMFDGDPILQDEIKLDNQVLIDYVNENLKGNIGEEYANPYGAGRITIY